MFFVTYSKNDLCIAACASYQCANGGSCVETNGTAKCKCPKGFSGEHCGEKGKCVQDHHFIFIFET